MGSNTAVAADSRGIVFFLNHHRNNGIWPRVTVMDSVLNLIVAEKPAIQIPDPRTMGTTTIKTAAPVSPDTILNTENDSIRGAAKIMTQPATMRTLVR